MDDIHLESKMDGPASTWYETGIKESVVNYHNDSLSGLCTYYRPNGKKSSAETYTAGKITDLQCFDDDGNYTGATCSISKPPVLIHPIFSALDYIEDELHKQKHRSITYGDVEIRFTVTSKGTVENLVVVSSPDAALSKLILQIAGKMPAWSPAVTHNRKIDFPITLTVPYYGD